jgi:hypothetical protein
MRIGESDLAKKVLCTKPGGSGERRRGRPKLWWCDELEVDITWVGCRNWRNNAQSRRSGGNSLRRRRRRDISSTLPPVCFHNMQRNKFTFTFQSICFHT